MADQPQITAAAPVRRARGTLHRARTLVGVLAGTLMLLGLGLAQPVPHAHATPAGIDPNATGSLTLHKFAEPAEGGTPHDGAPLPEDELSDLTPLSGVEFTLRHVTDVDLTTSNGWEKIEGLTAADVVETFTLGPAQRETTRDGVAGFSDLDLGLYVVEETDPGEHGIVFPTEPFLVTIPTHSDGTWRYDVHAYPKNSVVEIEKDVVEDTAYGLGDTITWTVDSLIPHLPDGETLEYYRIVDNLDERLDLTNGGIQLEVAGTRLQEGTDYTVEIEGRVAVVDILALEEFSTDWQGETLHMRLSTTVNSNHIDGGTILNEAILQVNDREYSSEAAASYWSGAKLVNYAIQDGLTPQDPGYYDVRLTGGQFEVWVYPADETPMGPLQQVDAGGLGAFGVATVETPHQHPEHAIGPIEIHGETRFHVDEHGEALLPGLRILDPETEGRYWVIQEVVPAGYLPAEPAGAFDLQPRSEQQVAAGQPGDPNVMPIGNPVDTANPPTDPPAAPPGEDPGETPVVGGGDDDLDRGGGPPWGRFFPPDLAQTGAGAVWQFLLAGAVLIGLGLLTQRMVRRSELRVVEADDDVVGSGEGADSGVRTHPPGERNAP
ncbi:SpaH/EbpB family LPXTG-anchored major pilin [Nesterenkonia alba]|uniref:SpaH/EbpB family LPXTG-anchored major pilin n=1 Tax=Nesterenkonia alba TaxID=515814 RepID=UPI0003B57061|nr:SpaH/EbpB family LPXTG-anchored major pilin [Nesterenkonia alba]